MKILLSCVLVMAMCGCSSESSWHADRKVETSVERACVLQQERELLGNPPRNMSGHDQDWDDAIKAAHTSALDTCCKTRLYERRDQRWTGHMKEVGK